MIGHAKSALVAGLLASVIWMIIATAADMTKGAVIGWGIGFLIIGAVGTFVIAMLISRTRPGQTSPV